jgi:hypothetical protein
MSEGLTLVVELSEEAQKKIARVQNVGGMLAALAREMDGQNQLTLSHIMRHRLTGRGPFPPSEHKLGVVTGRLRGAAWASPAAISGNTITSAIGDNVGYAWLHEHGADFTRKGGKVRLRTDRSGNLIRHGVNGKLATFARASHKRVKEVAFGAHQVHVPARAPFWTGIQERLPEVGPAMGRAATRFLKEQK